MNRKPQASDSRRWLAQYLERLDGRRVPILEPKLLEDARDVNLHGVFGTAKYRADVAVGFSLRNPQQHFSFSRSQAE